MYRILALSGGGVRGLFQASLLARAEDARERPLRECFDLIAATSTGAIVGAGIAAGVPCRLIADFYKRQAATVFRPRPFAAIRRGPRYDARYLEDQLSSLLDDHLLHDLPVNTLFTSSIANTFEGHIFLGSTSTARLIEAVLASCAAPTYFPPRTVGNESRLHVDGGLWANDPTAVAVGVANAQLGIPLSDMRVLSVGTGRIAQGRSATNLMTMRSVSVETIRYVFDFTGAAQSWHTERSTRMLLGDQAYLSINPTLRRWIPLDSASTAVDDLPALAESEFDRWASRIDSLTTEPAVTAAEDRDLQRASDPIAAKGIAAGNVIRFTPARKYYAAFRPGRESITAYVSQATTELVMVSINLFTAEALESILETFEVLLTQKPPVKITLSLLDPDKDYLMQAVAGNLDLRWDALQAEIRERLSKIVEICEELPRSARSQMGIRCHGTLPMASAILIDPNEASGTVQLETKAYRAKGIQAFGFEVANGSDFYSTLVLAYRRLVADGRSVLKYDELGNREV